MPDDWNDSNTISLCKYTSYLFDNFIEYRIRGCFLESRRGKVSLSFQYIVVAEKKRDDEISSLFNRRLRGKNIFVFIGKGKTASKQ